jgi:hypothetical protein
MLACWSVRVKDWPHPSLGRLGRLLVEPVGRLQEPDRRRKARLIRIALENLLNFEAA